MKKLLITTTIFFSALFSYAQEKIYFPLFEVLNVHYGYQYSTSVLLKTYVDNNNKYTIILPDKPDSVYPTELFTETQRKAKLINAPYFLTGELIALNDLMILTVSLYKSDDGSKIWNEVLKAHTPDDLDPLLQRVAKSLGSNNKADQSEDIYSVSDYDSKELSKMNSNYNFGIFVGGIYTVYTAVGDNFSGGFGIRFCNDIRDLILNVNGEAYFGDAALYDFNLSTLYPFSKKKNTPYIGAGLGYGGTTIKLTQDAINYYGTNYSYTSSESNSGLLFFLHAGYIFKRTSDVHLQAGASYYIATYQINSKLPTGAMINVTFLF